MGSLGVGLDVGRLPLNRPSPVLVVACKVLYQLQPRSGDKAIACIINLSDTMSGCTLQVREGGADDMAG